jgi:hypothetical protein
MPEQSPTRFTMVPARRSSEPTARRRARRIVGTLFLASALSVVAIFLALVNRGAPATNLSSVRPEGRDLAYTAAVNYLAGSSLNVPHAGSFDPEEADLAATGLYAGERSPPLPYRSLSWVGFTPQHFGSEKAGFTDFEVHHFLVVLAGPGDPVATEPPPASSPAATPRRRSPSPGRSGTPSDRPSADPSATQSAAPDPSSAPSPTSTSGPEMQQLDVSVLLTRQGPRLAAAPAFSAWRGLAGGSGGNGDYSNYGSLVTDIGDPVKKQIARWAKAYVTGDSAELLAITGDQDARHRYAGLSGFTLPDSDQSVQALSSIKAFGGRLVVRVRVLLARTAPPGTVATGPQKEEVPQFTTFADFDLLVGAPTGAQPPVVAWGPAGSAAELEPFSNALSR